MHDHGVAGWRREHKCRSTVAQQFTISKADRQITFEALADKKFGDADFNVVATASSNLAVSLAASGNCTVAGTQVHITGAGPCTITASQDGDANIMRRLRSHGPSQSAKPISKLRSKLWRIRSSVMPTSRRRHGFIQPGSAFWRRQLHTPERKFISPGPVQCTITASQDGDANINAAAACGTDFLHRKSGSADYFRGFTQQGFR